MLADVLGRELSAVMCAQPASQALHGARSGASMLRGNKLKLEARAAKGGRARAGRTREAPRGAANGRAQREHTRLIVLLAEAAAAGDEDAWEERSEAVQAGTRMSSRGPSVSCPPTATRGATFVLSRLPVIRMRSALCLRSSRRGIRPLHVSRSPLPRLCSPRCTPPFPL